MASYIQTTIHSKIAKYPSLHPDNKKPALKDSAASPEVASPPDDQQASSSNASLTSPAR